jgi:N-acetylglucosamine-6-sulfatase
MVQTDPYQLNNIYTSSPDGTSVALGQSSFALGLLENRLDALLFVLKTCRATSCSDPWETLLPESGVTTLAAAMSPKYDQYFTDLPKVAYSECAGGYIAEVEGPVWEDGMASGQVGGLNSTHVYGRMGVGRGLLNRV